MVKQYDIYKMMLREHLNNLKGMIRNVPLKLFVVFFLLQLLIVLLAFIVIGLIPVSREVKQLSAKISNQTLTSDDDTVSHIGLIINEIRNKEHYEAFLKAKLKLAKADSISLFIDLNDSLVYLKFKGVYLRSEERRVGK